MILVDVDRVGASRPNRPLFRDLSMTVSTGDRLGIVGLNGCGKSTLLRVLANLDDAETGDVRRGRSVRVGFLDQHPNLPAGTVRDAVGDGWEAEAALDRLGMTPYLDADVSTLSGGQAKRVALARVLVADTDLLILDEPTNHLDVDAIRWLEDHLADYRGGLILVTHDRHVLDRVTSRILELDRGKGYVHEGGYASWLEARFEREEQAASSESVRQNLARRELAWLRRGAPARTSKSKSRIRSATALVNARPEAAARTGDLDLSTFGASRLGDVVIEAHDLAFAWPGQPALFEDITVLLDPRERLAIAGPNGSGKTTLLEVLAMRRRPTAGSVRHGTTVRLGVYDQHGAELDPAMRVRDAVANGQPPGPEHASLLERFWFDSDAQFAPIGLLSGGERRRLQLVLTLAAKPNVLFLDEPTNDLDLDTLRALEDFLDDWPGALITVSHDRAFVERTVDRTITLGEKPAKSAKPAKPSRSLSAPPSPVRQSRQRAEPVAAPQGKTRSRSTVGRLLQQAEKDLEKRTRERDRLVADLATAGTDHLELAKLGARIAAAEAAVAQAEEHWLALASEAEAAR